MTKRPTHDQKFNVLSPGRRCWSAGATATRCATCRPGSRRSPGCSGTSPGLRRGDRRGGARLPGKRGIPVTGEVDQRTMNRLLAMTTKPTDGRCTTSRRPGRWTRAARPAGCCASTSPPQRCAGWSTARSSRRRRAVRLGEHADPGGRVLGRLQEPGPRVAGCTTRRCRSRCSSPAARPSTTRRTSRRSATTAPRTAASTCATTTAWPGCSTRSQVGDKVVVYWS